MQMKSEFAEQTEERERKMIVDAISRMKFKIEKKIREKNKIRKKKAWVENDKEREKD